VPRLLSPDNRPLHGAAARISLGVLGESRGALGPGWPAAEGGAGSAGPGRATRLHSVGIRIGISDATCLVWPGSSAALLISNLLEATPGIEPGIAVLQMSVAADQAYGPPAILGDGVAAEMVAPDVP